MAKVVDDGVLLGRADANGRPLLAGQIDLQMLVGENAAREARNISGHGSDHGGRPDV